MAGRLAEPLAGVPGPLGSAHDLTDKARRIAAVADAAQSVRRSSSRSVMDLSRRVERSDGAFTVENTALLPGSANRSSAATCKNVNPTNHMRPAEGGAFILP